MHSVPHAAYLTTPPSSVGKSSHDYDSSDEPQSRLLVQTPPSSPPELPQGCRDSNDRIQKCSNHPTIEHSRLTARSKRRRSPSSDDTSPDSENELFAFLRIPPIMDRLPSIAGHAQKRCLESGETDMSLADIQEGKDILACCLKLMPRSIVGQALIAKEADCKYKCLSTLAMAWAAEARAQDKQLHEMLIEEELAKYAVSAVEASILQRVLVGRSVEELDADVDFCVGAYSHDFQSFSVAISTLNQIEGAASCLSKSKEEPRAESSHLEDDSASSDFDIND
ncbi:hypothetical protein BD769DRAFT_1391689 [Suillus cothurnatus]|nr:hypothetical protein BD769DRAFT_1391689 [Suillus cothurnatus]